MRPPLLKILYIAGCSRTGSTIIGSILGQIPRFAYVGELREFWDLIDDDGQLCGCGASLRRCDFWVGILDEAFGGFSGGLARRYANFIRVQRPVRTRDLLLRPPESVRQRVKESSGNALSELRALYGAIATAAGAEIIVDGSKYPSYAFLLGSMAEIELYILHLVRDPRAVAYSWAKRTKRNPRVLGFDRMEAKGVLHTCRAWSERNLLTRHIWRGDPKHYTLLRYEDFVSDPVGSLQPVLRMVGNPGVVLPLPDPSGAYLAPCHSVGGNPSRFATGRVSLSPDNEWRVKFHPALKHAVSLLSYPWLSTYGYSTFGTTRPRASDRPWTAAGS